MLERKVFFALIIISILVICLVIITNPSFRQSTFERSANGLQIWPTQRNLESNIAELIERCLQHKEIISSEGLHKTRQCVKKAASKISQMKIEQLLTHTDPDCNQRKSQHPLSVERETARRRVESTAREVFYFITAKMDALTNGHLAANKSTKQFINNTKIELDEYKRPYHQLVSTKSLCSATRDLAQGYDEYLNRALSNDLYLLRHVDGDEELRVNESRRLGKLVQRRLHALQNPQNCSKAKLVVCNLGRPHGFTSMLHEATMCLLTAYATHRTLVLTTNGWRFAPSTWDTFMMPVSATCTANDTKDMDPKNQTSSARVVLLKSLIRSWNNSPAKFRPLAIPADLTMRLKTFHGDPPAWWVGQLVSFLLRPQPHLQQAIETHAERIGFQRPIVGIQVRRTDKVNTEGRYYSLEEYMKHVEEYYDLRQQHEDIKQRRLFLATDDPAVFTELQRKYPRYNISRVEGNPELSSVKSRYTRDGLSAVLVDLHFLSMCDFVVCTFSSNMCRAIYELMQTRQVDASTSLYSLDSSVYYVTYEDIHQQRAIRKHEARSAAEISLEVGDLIHIQRYIFRSKNQSFVGNLRNGSSCGINQRTGRRGLYPSYKVVDEIVEERMGVNN